MKCGHLRVWLPPYVVWKITKWLWLNRFSDVRLWSDPPRQMLIPGVNLILFRCHRSNNLPPCHSAEIPTSFAPTLYILQMNPLLADCVRVKITLDSTGRNEMDGFYMRNKVNLNEAHSREQVLCWKDWLCAMINCCISHSRWKMEMEECSFKYQNLHHSTLSSESRCSLA